jgi:hypothetical protein
MKYLYKIINAEIIKKKVDDIEKTIYAYDFKESEWRFVAQLDNQSLLFEKVIQEPEHTFTVPNSTGIYPATNTIITN